MANNKRIYEKLPVGLLYYPRLEDPDTKYHKLGTYKAHVRYTEEEFKPIRKMIRDLYKQELGVNAPKDGRGLYYPHKQKTEEVDEDGDPIYELTGDWVLKVEAKNRMTKKKDLWDRKPNVWDTGNNLIKNASRVGGGSRAKVNIEVYCGETQDGTPFMHLIPTDVLILDLVESKFGGGNPFDEEDRAEGEYVTDSVSPFSDDEDASEAPVGGGDF